MKCLAQIRQCPENKLGISLILVGPQGAGKSMVWNIFAKTLGSFFSSFFILVFIKINDNKFCSLSYINAQCE